MDISETLAPRSDQINADDLVASAVTVTVLEVDVDTHREQPVHIVTREYGPARPYKPGLSMRRVIAKLWGRDSSGWVGKSMTLYADQTITFGKEAVGGIRISHMSGITEPQSMLLTKTRSKRAKFTVQPLPDAPETAPAPTADDVANCNNTDTLRAMWNLADNDVKALIRARVDELNAAPEETP